MRKYVVNLSASKLSQWHVELRTVRMFRRVPFMFYSHHQSAFTHARFPLNAQPRAARQCVRL